MINELYRLSVAMSDMGITADSWHRKYKPIPNITEKAPCIRIVFAGNQVTDFGSVDADRGKKLKKYGNNQGTFPAMNLAPLYRIENAEHTKKLSKLLEKKGAELDIQQIKDWCICNNWNDKFARKYNNCICEIPKELERLLSGNVSCEPMLRLIEQAKAFRNPKILHSELERVAFEFLEKRINIVSALQVLFYVGKPEKSAEDDYGTLSVILDSRELEYEGIPSISIRFTKDFNRALMAADADEKSEMETSSIDAFGNPFVPLEEPMPSVKLEGGFDVSLRTMFKGQPCQTRYNRIENATYPIAPKIRTQLKTSLEWLSSMEMEDKTWVSTDAKEILFAYPSKLSGQPTGYASQFGGLKRTDIWFEKEAESFAKHIAHIREADRENYPENIQIFMLRKLDKARTKVIYSRCSSPDEVINNSERWQKAAENIPNFKVGRPRTPYPLHIAAIMNRMWNREGEQITKKIKVFLNYHGMELLFGVEKQVLENDLHILLNNSFNMTVYAGSIMNTVTIYKEKDPFIPKLKETLVLTGMLLYWLGSGKEKYMNEHPYLLGQLLKVSDSLHELYCFKERDGQIPNQLVGNSMYVTASEMPKQVIGQLALRMTPYITWAKANRDVRIEMSYKNKEGETKQINGMSAGYLMSVYERIATQLHTVFDTKVHFDDIEKAQLFLGYLAAFPKSDRAD